MGTCIICGTSADGPICSVHEEDAVFQFEGNEPSQLTAGRFYLGTIDGYADFGVFVNIGNVTGLLHRSKLDRRLESLNWEVGDEVCVQVNNVRDNGDIDLDWSIRQSPEDFRGMLVQTPDGDEMPDEAASESPEEGTTEGNGHAAETDAAPADDPDPEPTPSPQSEPSVTDESDARPGGTPGDERLVDAAADEDTDDAGEEPPVDDAAEEPSDDAVEEAPERVAVDSLEDRVGDTVRLEGVVAAARQTSGPTVFELEDETGTVDCAAFVEAGVRAYPEIEAGEVVRIDGEVRVRRDEIQIEAENVVALEDSQRAAVEERLDAAIDDRATPESVEPLGDDAAIAAASEGIAAVAGEIRRAVIESRPIVVRHDATTDGYVAGAAIERAVLPLIEDEHGTADSVYHYFDRRPLEAGVYDMNDATKDVTRMLGDRDRHGEKLPLFVFAAAASTEASTDGLELLDIYDAPRIVLDGRPVDAEVAAEIDDLVTVEDRTATTVAATVAAAVNGDVREDLLHLPAVSYWADTPPVYSDLAVEADLDAESVARLREAIALEAYYQSYEDKRELIIDLLFEKRTALAEQVSEQFGTKLDDELDTVVPNLEERTEGDVTVTVLDTDAHTHRYDFPPTRLLLDELARRLDSDAVVGVGTDELHLRTDGEIDLESVTAEIASAVPNAGVADPGDRQPKLEFLAGEREAVIDATVDALAGALTAPSP